MSDASSTHRHDYSQLLYVLPFVIFACLLILRDSGTYAYIFDWLPVLGRTIPYFCLSALMLCVFKYRGGSLEQLGICWPKNHKTKFKMLRWIILSAVAILAMRIFIDVASEPLLEFLPEKISRSTPLKGDLTLLMTIIPIMWLVVIAEEVLFRGLFINYLAKLFGGTTKAWLFAIILSAFVFGLGHLGKGPAAVLSSGLGGLAYGFGYFLFRKNLWPVIIAHCSGNTLGFIGAYFDD